MRPMVTGGAAAGRDHLMDTQSLVPAVQELWNAWEIHFMILLSLSLQVFLFLFAGLRRRSSNQFLQTVLWLAYLAADSVAVFVLGHLAVRETEPGHQLMALWAPFVLVHLGGQDTITAFAKQDNDLWRRHQLNLVIQAGVGGYVVAKASWSDARLRTATVIMFVCGCFKYAERVLCLFVGSKRYLKVFNQSRLGWKLVGTFAETDLGKESIRRRERTMEEVKKDTSDTLDIMSKGHSSSRPPSALTSDARTIIRDIISVDAPLNNADNITIVAAQGDFLPGMLKGILQSSNTSHRAYQYVRAVLEYCYRRLYTKDYIRFGYFTRFHLIHPPILQTCLRFFGSLLFILPTTVASSIALALFMSAHKRGKLHTSDRVDITVTYALLVGAIVLDVSSAARLIFLQLSFYFRQCLAKSTDDQQSAMTCSQELGQQYNIIISRDASILPSLVCNCTKDHMSIKKFILDTLVSSGARKEWSIASTRGRLALQKWMDCHKADDNQQSAHHDLTTTTKTLKSLEEITTSSADFPTSVLVLHIATDICCQYGDGEGDGGINSSDQGEAVKQHKQTSTQLSNYIMYLVFKCGVMLTSDSQIMHDRALDEIRKVRSPLRFWGAHLCCPRNHKNETLKLFYAIKEQQQEEQRQDSMVEIIPKMHQESDEQQDALTELIKYEESAGNDDSVAHIKELQMNSQTLNSPVLPRAVAMAQELLSISDEAERWELIATVWVEMLYYTAPRCGGDFHYEHLSTGGEFVTHVLLLMYYLGPFLPPPS